LESIKPDLVFIAAGLGVGVRFNKVATPGKPWSAFAVRRPGDGEHDLNH